MKRARLFFFAFLSLAPTFTNAQPSSEDLVVFSDERRLDDRKSVHISNIERLAIVQPQELSHGSKSNFEPDWSISADTPDTATKPELRCKHLDFDSVKTICGESQQAMVYGFARCRYIDVAMLLQKTEGSPIKKVFDCALGGIDTYGRPTAEPEFITTLEDRVMTQIPFVPLDRHPQQISRPSKSGMTNLVFENYKRVKEGLSIIPCIFCIDIDDNPIPFNVENVTNNDNSAGDHSIALNELRRAYKLIHEFDDENIKAIAKETFKFVKLAKVSEDSYRLERLKAPWDCEEWDALWRARKAKPKSLERLEIEGYESNWREELRRAIHEYNEQLEDEPITP